MPQGVADGSVVEPDVGPDRERSWVSPRAAVGIWLVYAAACVVYGALTGGADAWRGFGWAVGALVLAACFALEALGRSDGLSSRAFVRLYVVLMVAPLTVYDVYRRVVGTSPTPWWWHLGNAVIVAAAWFGPDLVERWKRREVRASPQP